MYGNADRHRLDINAHHTPHSYLPKTPFIKLNMANMPAIPKSKYFMVKDLTSMLNIYNDS
jgi:hypothetical protein